MASSSGGHGGHMGRLRSSGSRFDILQDIDSFPEIQHSKGKRRRPTETTTEFTSNSFFTKNQKISDLLDGPKYLIMKRNEINTGLTLASVSPFLVMKTIEQLCGKVQSTKLLRDGSLLIHTHTKKQADKLITLKHLAVNINVHVQDHPTLNLSKGTVYCRDIIVASDEEIIEHLAEHHVKEVHRIKRKQQDGSLADTGLFVLTFNLSQLPKFIDAGYQLLEVRQYIPNPRRCFNCQRFGHGAKHCRQQPGTCGKCADVQHTPAICVLPVKCANCKLEHPAWDRRCPVFKHEHEIQKIQTTHRITNAEARKRFRESHPTTPTIPSIAYSTIATTSINTATSIATTTAGPSKPTAQFLKPQQSIQTNRRNHKRSCTDSESDASSTSTIKNVQQKPKSIRKTTTLVDIHSIPTNTTESACASALAIESRKPSTKPTTSRKTTIMVDIHSTPTTATESACASALATESACASALAIEFASANAHINNKTTINTPKTNETNVTTYHDCITQHLFEPSDSNPLPDSINSIEKRNFAN